MLERRSRPSPTRSSHHLHHHEADDPDADPDADATLAIGQLAPFTGPISTIAESFTAPVKLAVDEMNFSEGVNGHPVALTVADDGSALDPAKAALRSLVDMSHVDAVIGPSTSQLALGLMDQARRAPVVMCSGSNTYGPITAAAARSGLYFRTAPPDRLQAEALAQLVIADGHRRPVVIAAPRDAYTAPLATATVKALHASRVPAARLVTFDAGANPAAVGAPRAQGGSGCRGPGGVPRNRPRRSSARSSRPARVPNRSRPTDPTACRAGTSRRWSTPRIPRSWPGSRAPLRRGRRPESTIRSMPRSSRAGVEPFFSASTYDCTILVGLAATAAALRRTEEDPRPLRPEPHRQGRLRDVLRLRPGPPPGQNHPLSWRFVPFRPLAPV